MDTAILQLVAKHVRNAADAILHDLEDLPSRKVVLTNPDDLSGRQIEPRDVSTAISALPDILTVKEAAAYLRCTTGSIYAMMERCELNYIKIQSRRRIPKTALAQIIDPIVKGGWKLRSPWVQGGEADKNDSARNRSSKGMRIYSALQHGSRWEATKPKTAAP